MRLTLGKLEQGVGDGVPVNWGEGLAGSVAESYQNIIVQVIVMAMTMLTVMLIILLC